MKLIEISRRMEAENEPEEISVLLSAELLCRCEINITLESIWMDSGYKDWKYRVDPEDPSIPLKRHIHIAKDKHTSAKNMQASWNSDGTRHDRKSFNTNVGNVDRVREIARSVLKIAPNIALEYQNDCQSAQILTEDITSSEDGKIAYVLLRMA